MVIYQCIFCGQLHGGCCPALSTEEIATFLYLTDEPPLAINGVRLFVDGGFPKPPEPMRHQFKPLSPSAGQS